MKLRHSVKWMLMGALAVPHLTACSFGGSAEGEEEVEASEEGNAADAEEGNNVAVEGAEGNAAEGNAEANTAEGNAAEGNAEANAGNGAEGNVAFENADANAMPTAEGAVASNEIPPELLNSQNETAGAEGTPVADGNAAAAESNIPTDAIPATAEAAPQEGNAAVPQEGNAAAPAAPEAAPAPTGARVYFVSVPSAALKSAADPSASSVGSVSKGDPVLGTVEGNFLNVAGRGYIEISAISQTPVGRSVSPKSWR